jgi:hypothetical protein
VEVHLVITVWRDNDDKPIFSQQTRVGPQDENEFDINLYYGNVDRDLCLYVHYVLYGFTPDELHEILTKAAQEAEANQPLQLTILITLEPRPDGHECATYRRLPVPWQTHENTSVMPLSVRWGKNVKGRIPHLRQLMNAYLHWFPNMPSREIQQILEPEIKAFIKEIVSSDSDLSTKIASRISKLPDGPSTVGDRWTFLED